MQFSGKRALVTGAGKGIGRVTARALATAGAQVIALGRTAEDLDTLAAEIGCQTIVAELSDAATAEDAAHRALPVDLLVNCAGIAPLESVLESRAETLDIVHAVNLRAPVLIARVVAADLVRRGAPGAIVNVSSVAATVATRDHVAYCASKAALDAATRVMALELGPHGIRVNSVNPVVTWTPMAERAWADPAKSAAMRARIPLGRFAEPAEVAAAILFLLSDAAAMVNGITLPVDGGLTAS